MNAPTGASPRAGLQGRGGRARLGRRTRRLLLHVAAFLVLATIAYLWHHAHGMTLSHPSLLSGWGLLGCVVLLTLYNLRKKLPFWDLARSRTWLELHVYAGYLSLLLYLLHTGVSLPDGVFESTLAALFFAAGISGVVGIYVSRRFPPLLATRSEEVIFERIPVFVREQREAVQELVLETARSSGSRVLPNFYARRLHDFFSGPRHFRHHIRQSQQPLTKLLGELQDLRRFLGDEEKEATGVLEQHVRAKNDLDYHWAHQAVLKYWLFVHIPLAYAVLLFALVHVVLVHAFGGIR